MTAEYVSPKLRALNTPEGVDLSIEIASFGARIVAFLIDIFIIYGSLFVVRISLWAGEIQQFQFGDNDLVKTFWLLGWFVMTNCWFILFELGTRGATPGKRLLGLRVVARNSGRLEANNVVARNLMRDVEMFLPLAALGALSTGYAALGFLWALFFMFFPLMNKDRMRAGDLLGGTWVIRAPRTKIKVDLSDQAAHLASHFAFTPAQIAVYGAYEVQTLEGVLRGKDGKALSTVADVIRDKINWPYGDDDRAFLEAYYAAVRAKLEKGMLFGKKRRDKYDAA